MPTTRCLAAVVVFVVAALARAPVAAQGLSAPYGDSYTVADLGTPTGVPGPLGGLTFLPGDPNTIVIGGGANGSSGALYTIAAVRGPDQHIVGFTGQATRYADGAYNDGGVAYGPGGVLFLTQYPINKLAQLRPGSTVIDKTIDLNVPALAVASSVGAINFVPAGFPGEGQAKVVSYNAYRWYTLTLAADGNGTWDVTAATYSVTTQGGPEGFIYVPQGSPLFPKPSMLVSEYQAGKVTAFEVDANGDPKPDTRTVFMDGLSGAEGAVIDPITGDFLFSTFGGGNHVVAVRGFVPPPSTTSTTLAPTTTSTTLPSVTTTTTSTSTTSTTTSTSTTTTTVPIPCIAAPECDDADVCNGTETCHDGFCAPATAATGCRPVGRSVAVVSLYRAGAVEVVDVASRTSEGLVAVGDRPWGVAWQPDGARVWVTNRGSDSVSVVDPVGRAVVATVPVGREPLGLVVHPSGARVYVADHGDDAVSVIDARTSTVTGTIRVGDGPAAVVVNPAGTRLYVGNYRAGTVSVVDTATDTVLDTVDVGGFPLGLAIAPGGAKLYVTDYDSRVVVIGTVSNSVTASIRVGRRPLGVAVTRDGRHAFVSCAGDDVVAVLDATTDRVLAKRSTPRLPLGVASDPSTGEIWVANSNGAALAVFDGAATTDAIAQQPLEGTPVAFGQFIGVLPGDCPAPALSCDDADPFTDDGCNASAGCAHTARTGLDAIAAGAAAMAEVVGGVSSDGGALARRVLAQVPALGGLVAAAQTGSDGLRGVRRDVARLTKLIEAAARRGQLGTVESPLVDLARATKARLRVGRRRRTDASPAAVTGNAPCPGCAEGLD